MSLVRLVIENLRFYWRSNLAVALGVLAATAVLTGALVVGDSVRGSLLGLVLERLGRIDYVLVNRFFFREELASELQQTPEFAGDFSLAVPAIVLEATVARPASGRRAGRVNCYGVPADFWQLGAGGPSQPPGDDEIVLNRPLADRLQVRPGDEVILRLPLFGDIPADSALGRKTDTVRNRSLRVAAVIEPRGLGEFVLRPSQQTPLVAYTSLDTLQAAVDERGKANAIFVAMRASQASGDAVPGPEVDRRLQAALRPQLADYGLRIGRKPHGNWQLEGDHMLLEPAVEQAALRAYAEFDPQPVLTYLANTLAAGDRQIPYSTITALDPRTQPPLGPFRAATGETIDRIGDGEILLNRWAAEDLGVEPGAMIMVRYFLPESTHGQAVETEIRLRLAAIVAMEGAADDPDFTPALKGVTDQLSIADWDPPFPFDAARIRSADEQYWDEHKAAPKAFVSLATGRKLWSSRFGEATSVRFDVADPNATAESLAARLRLDPESLGFTFRPVKRLSLAASAGTTGFSGLFLGFSAFLIVAALALVLLLFRLAIDQRASQIGTLAALGWSSARVRRALSGEGLVVALAGAIGGTIVGVAYAWLLLVGLRTWWVAAISTPFVELKVGPASLIVGLLSGCAAGFAAILWALWRMRNVEARRLLSGETEQPGKPERQPGGRSRWLVLQRGDVVAYVDFRDQGAWAGLALLSASVLAIAGWFLEGEAQAGTFFGSGALVLVGSLSLLNKRLRLPSGRGLESARSLPLLNLASRNAGRNPLRSTLTIGLVAAAAFLLIAISAFRLEPPQPGVRSSGSGGFALIAESDQPIYEDLQPIAEQLGGKKSADTAKPSPSPGGAVTIYPLRLRPGDDASCLNLYQAQQPRLLGVTPDVIQRGGFAWARTEADDEASRTNPWLLLDRDLGETADGRRIIPAVVDANTATYSLHLNGLGAIYELPDDGGGTIPLQVVGLLKNSVLQGSLIISERALLEAFPGVSGYRVFLVDAPAGEAEHVAAQLDDALGDYGFDAVPTAVRLAEYMVVQNTYLETFQMLGALGLLLGTVGIAAVQLRNVFERRAELAILRAVGFAQRRLGAVVLLENLLLVLGGLVLGGAAAGVAIAPHLLRDTASIPWRLLVLMLGLVLATGVLTGLVAVRATLRAPLVAALRGD